MADMTPHKKAQPSGAVPVSRKLQIFVIAAAAAAVLFELLALVPYYVTNRSFYRLDFVAGVVITTIYPLLLFAAAYYWSPHYKAVLQRVFIAAIKTVAASSVITLLITLKNTSPVLFPWAFGDGGKAPSWVTSFNADYVMIAVALAAVIVFSLKHYKKR